MAKKRYHKHRRVRDYELTTMHILPLLFILGVVPLIVFGRIVNLTEYENWLFASQDLRIDFFSFYKSVFFVIAVLIQGLILIALVKDRLIQIKLGLPDYIIGLYLLFVLLSVFRAASLRVAFRGYAELHQGVFVLLGYGLIVFYGRHLIQNKKQLMAIIQVLCFSGMIVFFLGASQYLGYDFFKTTFAQYLILPINLYSQIGEIRFTFGARTIYATMYNTNFVGSYAALMVPFALALVLYTKKIKHLIPAVIFLLAMIFVMVGSRSRAGYLALTPSLVVMVILAYKVILRRFVHLSVILIAMTGFIFTWNHLTDGIVFDRFESMLPWVESERVSSARQEVLFESVAIDGHQIEILTTEKDLVITYDGALFRFADLDGTPLPIERNNNRLTFVDEAYHDYMIDIEAEKSRIVVHAYGRKLEVYYLTDGFGMQGVGGIDGKLDSPERFQPLVGNESLASGRGYIWSVSLPLLKNTALIGMGPDHYPYAFPQRDITGRLNGFGQNLSLILAHNMFIQIGVNTGVISLLLLLFLVIVYLFQALTLLFRNTFDTLESLLSLAIFTGVIAFMIAGVFNDQIMSTAPLFYGFLGIGFGLNRYLENQTDKP